MKSPVNGPENPGHENYCTYLPGSRCAVLSCGTRLDRSCQKSNAGVELMHSPHPSVGELAVGKRPLENPGNKGGRTWTPDSEDINTSRRKTAKVCR